MMGILLFISSALCDRKVIEILLTRVLMKRLKAMQATEKEKALIKSIMP